MHQAVEPLIVNPVEGDEHLLRRLGAAVVKHWETLTPADRNLILDQANYTTVPKNESVQLREQLQSIIREKRIDQNAHG